MAIPTVPGYTSMSGVSIPQMWAKRLNKEFYANTCLSEITNTDFTGDIKAVGDSVKINNLPDITITDYVIGQDIDYKRLNPSTVTLTVDKGANFAFSVNEVEARQSIYDLKGAWQPHAAKKQAIHIERNFFANIYADAAVGNYGAAAGIISGDIDLGVTGTPKAIDKTNSIDFLTLLAQVLEEQNALTNGMTGFVVIPAAMAQRIVTSELKDASLAGDGKTILRSSTGRIGMIGRLEVYSSNLLSSTGTGASKEYQVIAGTKDACCFASQFVISEVLKNQRDYGDLVRGLNIYGYKAVKPEALVHAVVKMA